MKYKVPEVARYRILRILQVSTQKRDKLPNCENLRVTENTEVQNLHGYGNHSRVPEKQKIDNYWSYRGVAEISAVKKDRKNKKQKTQSYEVTGDSRKTEVTGLRKPKGYRTTRKTKFRKLHVLFVCCVLFFAFFFQLSFSKKKQNIP